MTNSSTYLLDRKVADIMTSDVRTVSRNATMAEAAEVLVDHGVSGLPVVDEMGKCVGVLSSSDLVRRCWNKSRSDAADSSVSDVVVSDDGTDGPLHVEIVPEDRVGRHMSNVVQTIAEDRSAIDAADFMSRGNIHRLIVLDQRGCPVGVVSALDVLKILTTPGD